MKHPLCMAGILVAMSDPLEFTLVALFILQKVQPKRAVQADEGPIQRLPFLCEGQGQGGGQEQG